MEPTESSNAVRLEPFSDSFSHILAHLERIHLLVAAQVRRARRSPGTEDEFRGLYLTDTEIDALLQTPAGMPVWASSESEAPESWKDGLGQILTDIRVRASAAADASQVLRLDFLARVFDLTDIDVDILLTALAPELDLRYEKLYAYLQDDVTKKRASVDLVSNLFCSTFRDKIAFRARFSSEAPLTKHQLIQLVSDPSQPLPPLLARYVKVDDRVVDFLLGLDAPDAVTARYCELVDVTTLSNEASLEVDEKLRRFLGTHPGSLVYFRGQPGSGRVQVAARFCATTGQALLRVHCRRLLEQPPSDISGTARSLFRETCLQNAVIYWDGYDSLLGEEHINWRDIILRAAAEHRGITIFSGRLPWHSNSGVPVTTIDCPQPTALARAQVWERELGDDRPADCDLATLSGKFRLNSGKIRRAADTARRMALWRDADIPRVTSADVYTACREQSSAMLSKLARKVQTSFRWPDLVLPDDRMQQLREICLAVKHRAVVFETWGFESKLVIGSGVSVLFAGPSGTGKTMAASIMAHELGLDLYKIDLASIVSKYIGETEKNLSKLFAEAASTNAILFFDEADALFGKRTEVRDSHDRYANIEINYLLQQMEEYEGMVILATNLRKNMDEAFLRRIQIAVEFPFPDFHDRVRIWEGVWPATTPLSSEIDFSFLANSFELAGGNIRNIALMACYLAAENGGVVEMSHLIKATQREYQKMGKVVVDGEFGPYARPAAAI